MRLRSLRCSLPTAALACLFSCDSSTPSTQIVVVVDSSLRAGSELTRIDVSLYEPSGQGEALSTKSFELGAEADKSRKQFPLPLSFALTPTNENSTRAFRLVVSGSGDYGGLRGKLVESQLTSAFQPQKALRLDVFLSASCAGEFCSADADGAALTTCVEGACVPIPDRSDLPVLEGGALGGYAPPTIPIGEEPDAAQEAGVSDAGVSADADDLPPVPDAGGDELDASDGSVDGDASEPDAEVDAGPCPVTGCVCAPGSVASGDMCIDVEECTEAANVMYCASTGYACEESVAPGYTCRGHRADWRMPDSVVGAAARPSYTANGSGDTGSVLDNITGLEWGTRVGTRGMGGNASNTHSHEQAVAVCSERGAGWRVPSLIELVSIVDTTLAITGVAIDARFQQANGLASGLFWTSTVAPLAPTTHRQVSFTDGSVPSASAATARVRCVRSPAAVPSGTPQARYTPLATSAGLVVGQQDLRTGLYWATATRTTPGTYAEASAYCTMQAQILGVAARLPTYKELLTLLSYGGAAPYVDAPFAANGAGTFWTASGAFGDTARAYTVNFSTGVGAPEAQANSAGARCVASSI